VGNALLPFPLTERSVHLCVHVQRIFSADGPWPAPWMERVLPVVATLAGRHPERTVFTRFIPPERPDQMPGMWQRYYTRWRLATRECLNLDLLELMRLWRPFARRQRSSTRHAIPASPSQSCSHISESGKRTL
jgi:nicotinamidase-related amidase